MSSLPLFPLGTVLVPGQAMPLQLFEPRYLQLHRDLMALSPEERRVGIIRIRQGHEVGTDHTNRLEAVGCEGILQESDEVLVGGQERIAWLLLGARRFRLDGIDDGAHTAYAMGRVTWLDGELPDEGTLRAHAAAARAGLTVDQRQRILEIDDASERDRVVRRLVREELALQREFGARPVHQPPDISLN